MMVHFKYKIYFEKISMTKKNAKYLNSLYVDYIKIIM